MRSQDDIMKEIMDNVSTQVADSIKGTISEIVEQELTSNLTKALLESEFYRKLSGDMRDGLQSIYKTISSAAQNDAPLPQDTGDANKLFSEASNQLDEVRVTLEDATTSIMDVLELQMILRSKASSHLSELGKRYPEDTDVKALVELESKLGDNLTDIMTKMSFQDLTGQRIKRIISALQGIESTVFDMYMSTGLIIKGREVKPEKDFAELQAESKLVVSELKGPTRDASQDDVDDLLAQLGLD